MAFMFLIAVLVNLLMTAVLADIALGRYLDARLASIPQLVLPNGSIPNSAFTESGAGLHFDPRSTSGTDGFIRRPDGSIPNGTSMQSEMRIPFVNPPDNGDVILFRDAANELKPKESNPQDVRVYSGDDATGVLAQRRREVSVAHNRGWYRANGWWHYVWNGHMLPILAPSDR